MARGGGDRGGRSRGRGHRGNAPVFGMYAWQRTHRAPPMPPSRNLRGRLSEGAAERLEEMRRVSVPPRPVGARPPHRRWWPCWTLAVERKQQELATAEHARVEAACGRDGHTGGASLPPPSSQPQQTRQQTHEDDASARQRLQAPSPRTAAAMGSGAPPPASARAEPPPFTFVPRLPVNDHGPDLSVLPGVTRAYPGHGRSDDPYVFVEDGRDHRVPRPGAEISEESKGTTSGVVGGLTESQRTTISVLQELYPTAAVMIADVAAAKGYDFQHTEAAIKLMLDGDPVRFGGDTRLGSSPLKLSKEEEEAIRASEEEEAMAHAQKLREMFPEQSAMVTDMLMAFGNDVQQTLDMLIQLSSPMDDWYDSDGPDEYFENAEAVDACNQSEDEDEDPFSVLDEADDRPDFLSTSGDLLSGATAPMRLNNATSAGDGGGNALQQLAEMVPGKDRDELTFYLQAAGGDLLGALELLGVNDGDEDDDAVASGDPPATGGDADEGMRANPYIMLADEPASEWPTMLEAGRGGSGGQRQDVHGSKSTARKVEHLRSRFPMVSDEVLQCVLEDYGFSLKEAQKALGEQLGDATDEYRPLGASTRAASGKARARNMKSRPTPVRVPAPQRAGSSSSRTALDDACEMPADRVQTGDGRTATAIASDYARGRPQLVPGTRVPANVRAAVNSQDWGDMAENGAAMLPPQSRSEIDARRARAARGKRMAKAHVESPYKVHQHERQALKAEKAELQRDIFWGLAGGGEDAKRSRLAAIDARLKETAAPASRATFRDVNAHTINKTEVDLHGQERTEALRIVNAQLKVLSMLVAAGQSFEIHFITGKGLHSRGGFGVLRVRRLRDVCACARLRCALVPPRPNAPAIRLLPLAARSAIGRRAPLSVERWRGVEGAPRQRGRCHCARAGLVQGQICLRARRARGHQSHRRAASVMGARRETRDCCTPTIYLIRYFAFCVCDLLSRRALCFLARLISRGRLRRRDRRVARARSGRCDSNAITGGEALIPVRLSILAAYGVIKQGAYALVSVLVRVVGRVVRARSA